MGRGLDTAEAAPSVESAARIAAWVGAIEGVEPESYLPIGDLGALGTLQDDLATWWERFFRTEASPRRADTVRLGARSAAGGAPDLVRSEYDMAVARLEVIDSALYTLIRVSDPGVDVAEGAAAHVIVRRILAIGPDRSWDVRLPARLAEGEWYASAPGADVAGTGSFRDRIDVRVRGGRLELLCYKRGERERPELAGWFPTELRARVTGAPAR